MGVMPDPALMTHIVIERENEKPRKPRYQFLFEIEDQDEREKARMKILEQYKDIIWGW